jgi:hypothetical protein
MRTPATQIEVHCCPLHWNGFDESQGYRDAPEATPTRSSWQGPKLVQKETPRYLVGLSRWKVFLYGWCTLNLVCSRLRLLGEAFGEFSAEPTGGEGVSRSRYSHSPLTAAPRHFFSDNRKGRLLASNGAEPLFSTDQIITWRLRGTGGRG